MHCQLLLWEHLRMFVYITRHLLLQAVRRQEEATAEQALQRVLSIRQRPALGLRPLLMLIQMQQQPVQTLPQTRLM
ncbi:hypothetical protein D3C86_1681930 [compost metagenome]